jgi:hypothetical protein
MVGVFVMLAGVVTLYFRRPITRHLKRVEEREWGLQFEEGEPRTEYVTLAGLTLLFGGAFLLWQQ